MVSALLTRAECQTRSAEMPDPRRSARVTTRPFVARRVVGFHVPGLWIFFSYVRRHFRSTDTQSQTVRNNDNNQNMQSSLTFT